LDRGAIYFTNTNGTTLPVAVDKDYPVIYAVPTAIVDAAEAANTLAPILNLPVDRLQATLSKPHDNYELLALKVDASLASEVLALGLPGIYVDDEPARYYPLNTVAAQVLGFVGPNASTTGASGHYGVEGYDDAVLAAGIDMTLTIDPNIQIEGEKILQNLVSTNSATGGSIIVEDPKTGRILAMASYPTFDPNDYASFSIASFLNPTMQIRYEPGSVFKVLTMAAGIDAGKITPTTTYTDYGTVTISGKKLSNYDLKTHGPYGLATMTNVIEHSINTGAVFAEGKTGNDIFASYLKKFGLNEKTGVDLPGELVGNLSQLSTKAPQVAYSTASYGQGVAVTPLELVNAMATIANGGTLMRPYVNAALAPQAIRRAISTTTAAEVTDMMISAVDKAQVANINGYSLAGKTGTAFIPDLVRGGYTNNVIDSYVGFGPTSNPRFIALIKIDTLPSTAIAALSVVPAFKEFSQYIINYYNIPPDRPVK
jgi:cell division protein FtsI/penicillin-binding protein 2